MPEAWPSLTLLLTALHQPLFCEVDLSLWDLVISHHSSKHCSRNETPKIPVFLFFMKRNFSCSFLILKWTLIVCLEMFSPSVMSFPQQSSVLPIYWTCNFYTLWDEILYIADVVQSKKDLVIILTCKWHQQAGGTGGSSSHMPSDTPTLTIPHRWEYLGGGPSIYLGGYSTLVKQKLQE